MADESPDTVHGRLLESVHLSGYSFERACAEFEWLLDDDRWKKVGAGFNDIRKFTDTLNLSALRGAVEQRKKIAKRLAELETSQRAIGRLLGVDHVTVANDLRGEKSPRKDAAPSVDQPMNGENSPEWFQGEIDPAREVKRTAIKAASEQSRMAARAKAALLDAPAAGDAYEILHTDFNAASIADASVDCIITDPPYAREFLPLYSQLSMFAARVLKPGGSCLALTGHMYLPDVLTALGSGLQYHWTLAYLTPGGQSAQVFGRNVNEFWKPLLWFVRGPYTGDWIGDVIKSDVNDNDKRHHDWGQSESGFARIVERFSKPGQLIVDPFVGGGTTAVVALARGRRFIGMDIDLDAVKRTRARIRETELV